MKGYYPDVVEQGHFDTVQGLLAGWLSASILDFVALGEFWKYSVDRHVECCWDDESDDLGYN